MHAQVGLVEHEPEVPDFPDDREHLITIEVDETPRQIRPGEWLVSKLKANLGIDPGRVLAEITAKGLVDLADTARIHVREGERFITHARSGSSS